MIDIGLKQASADILVKIFKHHPSVNQVIVYGSRAKGNFTERSDIDLVIKNSIIDRHEIASILIEIDESDFPFLVDLQDYGNIKNKALLAHIDRVGKVYFQQ